MHIVNGRVVAALQSAAESRWLPPIAGALAFALTITMTLPVTSMLVPAVLIAPRRWRATTMCAAFGSALGATLLVSLFHHLGWLTIQAEFPALLESPRWQQIMAWTRDYGVFALFAVAALPLPQTPALIFCAISNLPDAEVLVAVLTGKLVKYGVVCGFAASFPERFSAFTRNMAPKRRSNPPGTGNPE